jgi:hypothetical protein
MYPLSISIVSFIICVFLKSLEGHRIKEEILEMAERQRLYDGVRSHPRLVTLDSMCFSYPGWELDLISDTEVPINVQSSFNEDLDLCKPHQMMHDGDDSSHYALSTLDDLELSYPGWENDLERTRKDLRRRGYLYFPTAFDQQVQGMKNKIFFKTENSRRNIRDQC